MHTRQPPRRRLRFTAAPVLLAATEVEHTHLGAPRVLDETVASHLLRLPFLCCTAKQGFAATAHAPARHSHCVLWMQPLRPRLFRAAHGDAPPTSPYIAEAGTKAAAQSAAEHKTIAAPREGRRGRRGRSRGGLPSIPSTARAASPCRPRPPAPPSARPAAPRPPGSGPGSTPAIDALVAGPWPHPAGACGPQSLAAPGLPSGQAQALCSGGGGGGGGGEGGGGGGGGGGEREREREREREGERDAEERFQAM